MGRRDCRYQWRRARSNAGGGPLAGTVPAPRWLIRLEPAAIGRRPRRIEGSSVMTDLPRVRPDFIDLIQRPDEALELARAALLVAVECDSNVDIDGELSRIRDWGEELASRIEPDWNNLQKLARLRAFLFEELGFRGDRHDYFSPSNS